MMLVETPWWADAITTIGIAFATAVLGWVGFQLKRGAKATDRAIEVLSDHLKDIKPEIRMLRMAINNYTLQHATHLDKALDTSVDEHGRTQSLVREQADRIVRKIEETQ